MTDEELTADANCRSCGAPIVWAHTVGGMRLPVDLALVAGGNVVLDRTPGVGLVATYTKPDPAIARYLSHFATCPDAAEWRRRPTARRARGG